MNNLYHISNLSYKGYLSNDDWTLCLGAGVCAGILPDWFELTRRIVNRCFQYDWNHEAFSTHYRKIGFSLDGWIQACWNKAQCNPDGNNFYLILEDELYRDLYNKAEQTGLKTELQTLLHYPRKLKKKEVNNLLIFFKTNYQDTSLIQIVSTLINNNIKLPSAIITFNADNLVYGLIWLFSIHKNFHSSGKFEAPLELFKKVDKPFQKWGKKVPIFHLHGLIKPSRDRSYFAQGETENLIFLESAYSKVAGSMFTWAQSTFLYNALNTRMVFVGLSMSDSNIRRWLCWTAENINKELTWQAKKDVLTLRHVWFNKKPDKKEVQNLLEVSLHHLSVKPIWHDCWTELQQNLEYLLIK